MQIDIGDLILTAGTSLSLISAALVMYVRMYRIAAERPALAPVTAD